MLGCLRLSDVSVNCRATYLRFHAIQACFSSASVSQPAQRQCGILGLPKYQPPFPSIYNQCGVMETWSRKKLKNCEKCLHFGEKRPLTLKFQDYVPKVFLATPIDVLCSNFVKFSRRAIGEIMHCLPDKKNFAWFSSCRYWADRAQNLSGPAPTSYSECSRFHPNRFTLGRSAEL